MDNRLPAEALIINGTAIEDLIGGYQTMGVSGRELIAKELETIPRSGGHGDIVVDRYYPAREITVRYSLIAKDEIEFRHNYLSLNEVLSGSNLELKFKDDMGYRYYGELGGAEVPPHGVNRLVSEFTLFCEDPFKYSDIKKLTGKEVVPYFKGQYGTLPSEIKVSLANNSNTVTIRTGGSELRLSGNTFLANDEITFDFKAQEVYTTSSNLLKDLDLSSNFGNFFLKSGQSIQLVESGSVEISFRERAL